jgi:hypothetical protein
MIMMMSVVVVVMKNGGRHIETRHIANKTWNRQGNPKKNKKKAQEERRQSQWEHQTGISTFDC